MTAIDTWITELENNKYSDFGQDLRSQVSVAVAALQYIESGLGPITGPEAANTVLAGPVSGAAADPTFRALVPADLPIATTLALGAVQPDGTTITISAGGVITAAIGSDGANPTATAGPAAINGVATTYMRSDAAPAIQKASAAQFGIVEVDGTTITAAAGVISAAAGAGPFLPLAGGAMTGDITGARNIIGNNAAGPEILGNTAASATVPTLVPNKASLTTGIGAQASGNLSCIIAGAEIMRVVSTGIVMESGSITPVSTSGIVGTTTNDNAVAGSVGEFISSTVGSGAAVALVNNTAKDITSITLTAGDWDIDGWVGYTIGSTTIISSQEAWGNTSSATVPSAPNNGMLFYSNVPAPAQSFIGCNVGRMRLSVAGATTVYLSTLCNFTVSTLNAYGFISARRVR